MVHRRRLSCLALGAASLLAACGGGGDSGSTSSPVALVPLSASNYQAVTGDVVDSVAGSDALTDSLALVTASNASPSAASLPASVQPDALVRYALSQVRLLGATGRVQAQATASGTVECVSGALAVTVVDADNNRRASAGDRILIVANNCEAQAGLPVVNGQMTLVLGRVSADASGNLSSGSLTMTLDNFSSAGVSLNGAAVVTLGSGTLSLDFNHLVATDGSSTRVLDYALTVRGDGTVSLAGPIEVDGSTYTLSTPVPVVPGAVNPSAGTVRIVDGHGNRVDVVLSPTGYAGSLYLKGDEVVDDSVERAW